MSWDHYNLWYITETGGVHPEAGPVLVRSPVGAFGEKVFLLHIYFGKIHCWGVFQGVEFCRTHQHISSAVGTSGDKLFYLHIHLWKIIFERYFRELNHLYFFYIWAVLHIRYCCHGDTNSKTPLGLGRLPSTRSKNEKQDWLEMHRQSMTQTSTASVQLPLLFWICVEANQRLVLVEEPGGGQQVCSITTCREDSISPVNDFGVEIKPLQDPCFNVCWPVTEKGS